MKQLATVVECLNCKSRITTLNKDLYRGCKTCLNDPMYGKDNEGPLYKEVAGIQAGYDNSGRKRIHFIYKCLLCGNKSEGVAKAINLPCRLCRNDPACSPHTGLEGELWRPFPSNPLYEASSLGRIRREGCLRKLATATNGYLRITIPLPEGPKQLSVHRVVAEAWIPNPDNKPEVNHKNGIRSDNRADNLEWVSRAENIHHALYVLKRDVSLPKGADAKLSKPLKRVYPDGSVQYYHSLTGARNEGVGDTSSITRVTQGKKEYYLGCKWYYISKEEYNKAIQDA